MAKSNDSIEINFRDMDSDEKKKLTDLVDNAVKSLPKDYGFEGKHIDISEKIRERFMKFHAETMIVEDAIKDKLKKSEWGIEKWKTYDQSLDGLIDFTNEFGDSLGYVELKGGKQLQKGDEARFMSLGKIREYLIEGVKALDKDEENPAAAVEKLIRDYTTKKDKFDVLKTLMAGIRLKLITSEKNGLNVTYFGEYGDDEKLQLAGLIAALTKQESFGGIAPDFEFMKEAAIGLTQQRALQWYKGIDAQDDRYTFKGKKTPIEYTQYNRAA